MQSALSLGSYDPAESMVVQVSVADRNTVKSLSLAPEDELHYRTL
jgi:hypothetical protein